MNHSQLMGYFAGYMQKQASFVSTLTPPTTVDEVRASANAGKPITREQVLRSRLEANKALPDAVRGLQDRIQARVGTAVDSLKANPLTNNLMRFNLHRVAEPLFGK